MAKATNTTSTRRKALEIGLPETEEALVPLFFALQAASEAMVGVMSRPYASFHFDSFATIERRVVALDRELEAIYDKLRSLKSISYEWRTNYINAVMSYAAKCFSDDPIALMSVLTAASAVPVSRDKTKH